MFTPSRLRTLSVIVFVCCLMGAGLQLLAAIKVSSVYFLGMLSWVFLSWCSLLGFRMAAYPLAPTACRKLGIRLMLVLLAVGIVLFTSYTIGIILSAVLLATFWILKTTSGNLQDEESAG